MCISSPRIKKKINTNSMLIGAKKFNDIVYAYRSFYRDVLPGLDSFGIYLGIALPVSNGRQGRRI